MKFIIHLLIITLLGMGFSSAVLAKVYKCKQADGTITYSSSPCKGDATNERSPIHKRSDDGAQTYLRFSDFEYTYQGFYEKFRCGNIANGLAVFPGKNTLTTLMRDIILEPKAAVHNLSRHSANYNSGPHSSSGKVCYISVQKRGKYAKLNFGMGSFHRGDLDKWNAHKIANNLAQLGYEFRGLGNDYRKSFSFDWRNTDFSCKINIDDDSEASNPYINVSARCSGSIQ